MRARSTWRVAWVGALALWANLAPGQENLLKNPGFEAFREGLPVDWKSYVLPQEGAFADLDRTRACQGRNSILLCTSTPYPQDPLNNWSQNVNGRFAGKTLVLRGAIRTEEAGEAVLWLQCWRKNPWSVVAVANTGAVTPVSGTRDWTRVEVRMVAPPTTDYLTVRCVLKGTGKAWFDDLSLTEETPAKPATAAPDKPTPSARPTAPTPPVPPKRPEPTVANVAAPVAPSTPQTDKALQELMSANQMLLESYQAVRETNQELTEHVKALQREVNSLRRQMGEKGKSEAPPIEEEAPGPPVPEAPSTTAAQEPTPTPAPQPAVPPPPLVPSARQGQEDHP